MKFPVLVVNQNHAQTQATGDAMKPYENWFEFMDRAKKNGLSPTMQESVDRQILSEGVVYLPKDTIEYYGKDMLRKISGCKHIEELKDEPNSNDQNSKR